jgi:methylglyoxal synthase
MWRGSLLGDPLDKQPPDPDIQAIRRVCNVHDVPLATKVGATRLIYLGWRNLRRARARVRLSGPATGRLWRRC